MGIARAMSKNEICVPEDVLDTLKIKVGDELDVNIRDGEIVLQPRKKSVVDNAFGIWADRDDIGDSVEYVRKMRAGWRKRTAWIDDRQT